jgi:hypothetical protein
MYFGVATLIACMRFLQAAPGIMGNMIAIGKKIRCGLALAGACALALNACHDRDPTLQQPYGPSAPSTSPTSTQPHQWPSPTQSVRSPSRPAPAGTSR